MTTLTTRTLDCGLTLVTETIPNVTSAAVQWLLPAGAAMDPKDGDGLATMLSEMIFRGAGDLDSRQHSDALDRLGVQRHADVSKHHLRLRARMLGERLIDTLPLLTDMVRRPRLPAEALDPVRSLCLQSLESLDDDPQHHVMLRLCEQHIAPPFNRHGYGERAVLEQATIDAAREAWAKRFVPQGSILAVAGAIDVEVLARELDRLLAGWSGKVDEPAREAPAARGVRHIEQETAQVHIGVAYDAPPEPHEDAMLERLATGVLSGGTSGRLFTEVRQKRSLCYSVGASYRAGRDEGYVTLYAGTTPDRAQQTLDVCAAEIDGLKSGAAADEFHRAANRIKSRLIMAGESTGARAAAIAQDQFRLGRPRSLDELAGTIEAVTLDALNAYLAQRAFGDLTIVSIGPVPLKQPAMEAAAS